jgi:hypothetical protein
MQRINDYNIKGKICFINLKTQKHISVCYRYLVKLNSVFCLSAHHEPFGIAPLEAMACGLPAIVTQVGDLFVILLNTVALWVFVGNIPKGRINLQKEPYNLTMEIVILRILRPVAYTGMIIIYFLILVNWDKNIHSQNEIMYIEIYVLIVVISQLFIIPIVDKDDWAERYNFLMPKFIIPINVFMIYCIYVRINEFGVDEMTYYLLITSIITLGVNLFWNFNKKIKNQVIVFIVVIILAGSLFGKWGVKSVSIKSQNELLMGCFERNNMVENGKIIVNKKPILKKDYDKIMNGLDFFLKKNYF